jgi:hypothetical protein
MRARRLIAYASRTGSLYLIGLTVIREDLPMTDPRENPYAAPVREPSERPPAEARPGLGKLLTGFLVLQIGANIYLAVRFFDGSMLAVEPNSPAWSFPPRGAFAILLALASAGILARRRLGWYAYLGLSAAAIPLNLARGGDPFFALLGAVFAPLLVWTLLRNRMAALR